MGQGEGAGLARFSKPVSPIVSRAVLDGADDAPRFREEGACLYRAGAVVCVTVAGGQGSRLGWNGPKATFPVYPDGTTLLAIHAAKISRLAVRYGVPAPWLIMTSAHTHDATIAALAQNGFYGLPQETILCISQESLPVRSIETRAPLVIDGAALTAPGGHGGFLTSPAIQAALEHLSARGGQYLMYNQIDNLLCRYDDQLFVGYTASSEHDVSVKLLTKEDPTDRLGTLVHRDGQDYIVEYSELPLDAATARAQDGSLMFNLGSPSMYCFRLSSLLTHWSDFEGLPVHEVLKEIPLSSGEVVRALKGEQFIHDALGRYLPMTGFVVDRADEFAPIKVPFGAESPEDARARVSAAYRRWCETAGARAERDGRNCDLQPEFWQCGCSDDLADGAESFFRKTDERASEDTP